MQNWDQTIGWISLLFWMSLNASIGQDTAIASTDQLDTTIYYIVEEMPRFWGCEELEDAAKAKETCATQAMLRFLYTHLNSPYVNPRESYIEGVVVLRFVVEKDGRITNIQVLRDPGELFTKEALRVVQLMQVSQNRWIPGKQNGEVVRVAYSVPVRFKVH